MRIIIIVTFLSLCSHFHGYGQATSENEVSKTLTNYREDFVKSMRAQNPEALSSYFKSDVRLMTEYQRTIIGQDNALAYYKAFFARFEVNQFDKTKIEILDLGSMAAESGKLNIEMKLKRSGKIYKVEGKYIDIWDKSDPKKMKLITAAWNYNQVVEDDDNLRFKDVEVYDVALKPHVAVNNNISFELAALNRLMEATVTQHDAKIWSLFYTDDAIVFHTRSELVMGRVAIDKYIEDHCKDLPVFEKLDVRNDRIDNLGNYVVEYASHIAVWRGGEYSGIGLGKDLAIWRREKDGSLKIFRHMGMYD